MLIINTFCYFEVLLLFFQLLNLFQKPRFEHYKHACSCSWRSCSIVYPYKVSNWNCFNLNRDIYVFKRSFKRLQIFLELG